MIHWLLKFLTMFTTLGFAAAAVVPDMGGGDAVDAATTSDADGSGRPADDAQTGTDDGATDAGDGKDTTANVEPKTADAKVDGRQLPPKVREVMEQLKAADPKAHGFLKDVLFRDRAYAKELPGGLAELRKIKETVSQLGEGGIEAIRAEQAEWNSIDESYNAADPRFVDIMVDANPQSFNKLAPALIGKFAQTDSEGYQRYMAGIMVASMQSANVLGSLNFAARLLAKGDAEGAAAEVKAITDWIGGIDQIAKSQPKEPEKNPDLDAREQRIAEAESKQWASQTASEVNTFKTTAIKKELAQYAKGVQIDDETYQAIEDRALKYINDLLMADPSFTKTFNAYCENKDSDGVTRYMKSRLQELLPSRNGKPGPVEKAYKLFFRGAASPKPKLAPQAGAAPKLGSAPAPPAGWIKVGKAPASHEIDLKASPFEMRFKQAAVLKNGKKVYWGTNAPA